MKGKKINIGFSMLDVILLILAAACILSVLFRTQLHHFFGQEEKSTVQYTFLIQNASEEARNYPKVGEEIFLSESFSSIGSIEQISSVEKEYQKTDDAEDRMEVVNLTCKGVAEAYESDLGYTVGGINLKAGAEFYVQTDSASFTMIVTMVKLVENSEV